MAGSMTEKSRILEISVRLKVIFLPRPVTFPGQPTSCFLENYPIVFQKHYLGVSAKLLCQPFLRKPTEPAEVYRKSVGSTA